MPDTKPILTPYAKAMWTVLAVCVALAIFANPLIRAFAEFGAAYAIWNLAMVVPGPISRRLEGRNRTIFTVAAAVLFPLILSLYFLQRADAFDPWASLRYFASWYALVPIGIFVLIWAGVGEKIMDVDHPVTGFMITACLLFVPMYLGYHGVALGSDEDGYTADPPDPVLLKAQVRAGYHSSSIGFM